MNKQSTQRRRDQRWRMNRQMKDRRRLNLFLVEKRVRHLEGRQEVVTLDLENTHDLMAQLEQKVSELIEDKRSRQAVEKLLAPVISYPKQPNCFYRLWRGVINVLRSKGNP